MPRLINVIADNALLEMFVARHSSASHELLSGVCLSLGLEVPSIAMPEPDNTAIELGFCPDEIAANVASEPMPDAVSSAISQASPREIDDPLAFLGSGQPSKEVEG